VTSRTYFTITKPQRPWWRSRILCSMLLLVLPASFRAAPIWRYRADWRYDIRMSTQKSSPVPGGLLDASVWRQRLWSATRHQLVVPRYRLSTYGRRAFSVVCPSVRLEPSTDWAPGPDISIDSLRDLKRHGCSHLK